MKFFELYRHSISGKDKVLSEKGERLAKYAGNFLLHPYAKAFSSPKERAIQTLKCFGFEEFETVSSFSTLPGEKLSHLEQEVKELTQSGLSLLSAYFAIPAAHPVLKQKGEEVLWNILTELSKLNDGARCIGVSHGGTIEPAILTAIGKEFSLDLIGKELSFCEGVRFIVEENRICIVEIIRLPEIDRFNDP